MKKFFVGLLLAALTLTCFSGCGKKEEVEEGPVYELTPLTEDQLEENKYYVKNGNTFYELPMGTSTMTDGADMIAKETDPHRVIYFNEDDVCIPTLYKDDTLVFTTPTLPDGFTWERYYDGGYTFGIFGLEATDSGNYSMPFDNANMSEASSFFNTVSQTISGMPEETAAIAVNSPSLVIDTINGSKISAAQVTDCGSILGLSYNKSYNVDTYAGSLYIPLENVVADTHIFHSYELFTSSICNYMQANYIQIVVPDALVSGYYFINGAGFVKYIDNTRAQGIVGDDFNEPYYLYDENGNMYTRDEQATQTGEGEVDPSADPSVPAEDAECYENSIYVDCSNQRMTIDYTYEDAMVKNADGSDIVFTDDEVGVPYLYLFDPDGLSYVFSNSNTQEKTLSCSIENPISGLWTVKIYNSKNRMFDLKTTFVSGHNDSLVHTGSGTGNITYYNPYSLLEGAIKITWSDTTKMPSNIVIETPTGEKINRDSDLLSDYQEGRGYAVFYMKNIIYGDYKVAISGESLGRVRVSVESANELDLTDTGDEEDEFMDSDDIIYDGGIEDDREADPTYQELIDQMENEFKDSSTKDDTDKSTKVTDSETSDKEGSSTTDKKSEPTDEKKSDDTTSKKNN